MKRFIPAFALLTVASLAFSGCGGDDDDDSAGTAGKGSTAGTSSGGTSSGGSDGDGGEATGNPNLGCDPEAATTCQNETDCPYVVDGTARTTAQTCGKSTECLSGQDPNCARSCILESLEMTEDCAGCYADFVNCTIAKCLGDCLQNPNSEACTGCQVSKGCRETFDTCSGLPQ
jgi:hypothetical protein